MNSNTGFHFAIAICTLGLSGCYVFDKLPFKESELKSFSETVFAEDLIDIAQRDLPEEARQMLEEEFQDESDNLTYTISEDLMISLEKREMGWSPGILMKNDSHYMACEILTDDDIEPPPGVTLTPPEEEETTDSLEAAPKESSSEEIAPPAAISGDDPTIVSGTEEGMKEFLLELASSSPKACLAFPIDRFVDLSSMGE